MQIGTQNKIIEINSVNKFSNKTLAKKSNRRPLWRKIQTWFVNEKIIPVQLPAVDGRWRTIK